MICLINKIVKSEINSQKYKSHHQKVKEIQVLVQKLIQDLLKTILIRLKQ